MNSVFVCNGQTMVALLRFIFLLIPGLLGYYYLFQIVKPPKLAARAKFKRFLMRHCPILKTAYWPTFWCVNGRFHTVVSALLRSHPRINYDREILQATDGGQFPIDWHKPFVHESPRTPIVLFLPGITGSSEKNYMLHLVKTTAALGYRAVVLNYRGLGGSKVVTARFSCATDTDDLKMAISHIKAKYPDSPLMAVGVSMGGIKLSKYLCQVGEHSGLIAAMLISAPWNGMASTKSVEEPLNRMLFNRRITRELVTRVRENAELLSREEWFSHEVFDSRTCRDFDHSFTLRQYGYQSTQEYYKDGSIDRMFREFPIPVFCLNAADDAFSPGHAIPLREVEDSQHTAVACTSHGGHFGFLEGVFPRDTSYMFRLYAQYANAVFENQRELKSLCSA